MHDVVGMEEDESLANSMDDWKGFVLGNSTLVREALPLLEMIEPRSPCGQNYVTM